MGEGVGRYEFLNSRGRGGMKGNKGEYKGRGGIGIHAMVVTGCCQLQS